MKVRRFKESIGKGSFGSVVKAEKDGVEYALKTISKTILKEQPFLQEYIEREMATHKTIVNDNVCRLYETYEDEHCYQFLLELGQCNLIQIVNDRPNRRLGLNESLPIIKQILNGLSAIHQLGYVHRDIKLDNVLKVAGEDRYVLADFGFIKSFKLHNDLPGTYLGSQYYMAPQILSQKQEYNQLVDIWALGVLAYALIFGKFPFNGINICKEIDKSCIPEFSLQANLLKHRDFAFPAQDAANQELADFFKHVFQVDPSRRMSALQALAHPLLNIIYEEQSIIVVRMKKEPTPPVWMFDLTEFLSRRYFVRKNAQHFFKEDLELSPAIKYALSFQLMKYFVVESKSVLGKMHTNTCFLPNHKELWPQVTTSPLYNELVIEFQKNVAQSETELAKYERLLKDKLGQVEKLIPGFVLRGGANEKCFEEFKDSYRRVTSKSYQRIGLSSQKARTNAHRVRLLRSLGRVFLMHCINRIFQDPKNDLKEAMSGREQFQVDALDKWLDQGSEQELRCMVERIKKKYFS